MSEFQHPNTTNNFTLRCHLATQFNECVQQYANMAENFTNHIPYLQKLNPYHFDLLLVEVHLLALFKDFPCQK